jgi:hypothetical protein
MKTKCLLLLFAIVSANVFSQSVFPETNAIWHVLSSLGPDLYYGMKGDTIIEGKTYQKLYSLSSPDLSDISNSRYFGAFYQEDKKVWFRTKMSEGEDTDFLLYDFSKNVGDTIHHGYFKIEDAYFFSPSEYEWITIIDNIEENQSKKIFSVTSGYYYEFDFGGVFLEASSTQWIEGAGGDYGLFFTIFPIPTCACPTERQILACLKENDVIKYLNTEYCDDCFSCSKFGGTDMPKILKEENKLNIFQEGDRLLLEAELTVLSVSIFDSCGKEILKENGTDFEKKKGIDVGYFLKGVYIIKATLKDKKVLIDKWIKR